MTDPQEDELATIHKSVLTIKCRMLLTENIEPDRFFPHLRAKQVLNESDADEIKAEKTRRDRASKFIDILSRKGSKAYNEFCKALLKDRSQLFIVKAMNEAVARQRSELEREEHVSPESRLRNNWRESEDQVTFDSGPFPPPPFTGALPMPETGEL